MATLLYIGQPVSTILLGVASGRGAWDKQRTLMADGIDEALCGLNS